MSTLNSTAAFRLLLRYLAVEDEPRSADVILALGSDCAEVALRAAELHHRGLAPLILFSGDRGRLTGSLTGTEAEYFKGLALDRGVPEDAILTEELSTNALENIRFSAALLRRRMVPHDQIILVTQPVLQRRAFATVRRQWPGVHVQNCPPPPGPTSPSSLAAWCSLAVGEMKRLSRYAAKGDIEAQKVPAEVELALRVVISNLPMAGEAGPGTDHRPPLE